LGDLIQRFGDLVIQRFGDSVIWIRDSLPRITPSANRQSNRKSPNLKSQNVTVPVRAA
jgi:hypothetical protein